ncbi:hypothetical protein ELJ50_30345, partial [Klebsiella pneumoniae]|nr:hypothetical protein [Klebsiella pneumoniae]
MAYKAIFLLMAVLVAVSFVMISDAAATENENTETKPDHYGYGRGPHVPSYGPYHGGHGRHYPPTTKTTGEKKAETDHYRGGYGGGYGRD